MTIREALQAVYDRNGALTPAIVVEEARDPQDDVALLLHSKLTWDDDEAAERWRLVEAAKLIRKVMVVYKPTPRSSLRSARAYVSVPTSGGRSYEPIEKVALDPLMAKIMLAEAERAWRDLRARYGRLAGFVEMIQRDLNGDADAA